MTFVTKCPFHRHPWIQESAENKLVADGQFQYIQT